METIYRPIAPHRLSKSQLQAKLQKDSEYEIAVQNLTVSWKRGEITHDAYRTQKAKLWDAWLTWAKANGLYEEVSPEQQLAEAESALSVHLERVNQIRSELSKSPLEVKEKSTIRSI